MLRKWRLVTLLIVLLAAVRQPKKGWMSRPRLVPHPCCTFYDEEPHVSKYPSGRGNMPTGRHSGKPPLQWAVARLLGVV